MARKTYPRSDETFKVLSGNEAAIAREMECDVSYINKVKNDKEPDRFPPFREIFRAGAGANAPVEIWINDLLSILARAKRSMISISELSGNILKKIQSDSAALQEILQSSSDNHLDQSECHSILTRLKANDAINQQIRDIVLLRLGELKEGEK